MHAVTSEMASSRLEQCELTSYETGDLESVDSDCSDNPPIQKRLKTSGTKKVSTCKFKRGWTLPQHISSSSKGDYCRLCSSHFSVAHGGFNDVKRHVSGTVHQQRLKDSHGMSAIGTFFQKDSTDHQRNVISAEVHMANFIAMHNLSFQTADHLSDLLPAMFPDSKIAGCKHTKTKAICCDALDPYYKKPVVEMAQATTFNLLCDESNDKGAPVELLTILVRIFDSVNGVLATRHLDTVAIVDLTANGIFAGLESTLKKYGIPFSNMLSFTSDTCNVMKGARKGVIALLRKEQPKVLDVHCTCHVVSLSVKAATKTLPIKLDELLVDVYYHFHHSVKRIESLKDFSDFCSTEYKSILKHCETRWLSLTRSLKRTLGMWDPLCSYFSSHPDVDKPGKVKNIANLLTRPLTKAWMLFLSNILPVFDKFNVYFQTSSTSTIHKLHGESERLLKKVLSFFIHPRFIRSDAGPVTEIAYMDHNCQLTHEDIYIGDDTSALLLHLEDEGEDVESFYCSVVRFYEAFVTKQLKVFDFKSEILQSLAFLDPPKSQNMPPSTFSIIQECLPVRFDKAQVSLEFREFAADSQVTSVVSENRDALAFWMAVLQMKSPMEEPKYVHLATLALELLAIPASNADSERVFSLVRRVKTDFRASLAPETLSSLIGCHFNNTNAHCCKLGKLDDALLKKAKACTRERNLSYNNK